MHTRAAKKIHEGVTHFGGAKCCFLPVQAENTRQTVKPEQRQSETECEAGGGVLVFQVNLQQQQRERQREAEGFDASGDFPQASG